MTPDELKARCDECSLEIAREIINTDKTTELESLCREMIAEGLERAAVEFERRKGDRPQSIMEKMYRKWCREEAQRVKERA